MRFVFGRKLLLIGKSHPLDYIFYLISLFVYADYFAGRCGGISRRFDCSCKLYIIPALGAISSINESSYSINILYSVIALLFYYSRSYLELRFAALRGDVLCWRIHMPSHVCMTHRKSSLHPGQFGQNDNHRDRQASPESSPATPFTPLPIRSQLHMYIVHYRREHL